MSTITSGFLQYFTQLSSDLPIVRKTSCQALMSDLDLDADSLSHRLEYTAKRLVRGLCSFVHAARQGFALALTEILLKFPMLTTSDVFTLAKKHLYPKPSSMMPKELRNLYLGYIFFIHVLMRSGRMQDGSVSSIMLSEIISKLFIYMKKKRYLRELCMETIIVMLGIIPEDNLWTKKK